MDLNLCKIVVLEIICYQLVPSGIRTLHNAHGEIKLKTDDGFNDRLKEIKKFAGSKSTISDSIR